MMNKKLAAVTLLLIVLSVFSVTCNAVLLKRVFSGNGGALSWTLYESNPDNAYSLVDNDMYVVHIDNKGEKEADVRVGHREFSVYKGIAYTIMFKITATKDCMFNARISDCTNPYNEAWSLYNCPLVANEELVVNEKFTSPGDVTDAELSFELGGMLAGGTPYDVKIISVTFAGKVPPTPTPIKERNIRANQLGYFQYGPKKATLKLDREEKSPLTWNLKNSSDTVVATGKTTPAEFEHSSNENVHIIDFSDYKKCGKDYQLVVGDAISFNFDIGNDLYSKMKYDSLKYFYHARSGTEIKMPYCVESRWARPAGHPDDTATLREGTGYTGPETLDCTGGWYDDSDHNKYLVNGGLALWILQNQYEHSKGKGIDKAFLNQLNIPESSNSINDLLDEARWEMEWMLRMQIPSGFEMEGMAAHKVANENWTGLATRPDQDTQKRLYSPPSTAATLNLASCAAQAARIWRDSDPVFSNKCIDAAVKAYSAAKENPAVIVVNKQETGSSPYGDDQLEDEFYWAACELYATTQNANYLDDLKSYKNCFEIPIELSGEDKGIRGCFNCSSTGALGTITLALALPDEFPEAIDSIRRAADTFISEQKNEGYGMPLPESTFISTFYDTKEEVYGYPNESNSYVVYKAIVLAYAYDFSKDNKYLFSMIEAMDYLLGRNANVKSYISGYGDDPIKNPNHRFFCPNADPSFPPVPPGFLVSGPNSGGHDHLTYVYRMKELNFPAQKWYVDNEQAWSNNILKINLNSALAWVTYYIDAFGFGPEDINRDGAVSMNDIVSVANVFGMTESDAHFDTRCDLNGDGCINLKDVMKIAYKFGSTYASK